MTQISYLILLTITVTFTFSQCQLSKNDETRETTIDSSIHAIAETDPVSSKKGEDAADDPAIWVNPHDPTQSRVIGTNKKGGLHVYDLAGNDLFFTPLGLPNNVDVRSGFPMQNDKEIIIVGASDRSFNGMSLMQFIPESDSLKEISADTVFTAVDEAYGFCLYNPGNGNDFYAFLNGKDGQVEQYRLTANNHHKIKATLVRTLQVPSQPEGMVADDELGYLYVGEESSGIWKFYAHHDSTTVGWMIEDSRADKHDYIVPDVEGLTLYKKDDGKGYLIASIQGSHSFALFTRKENNFITTFRITTNGIDGAEETDGVDVVSQALSTQYPKGLLVVQDGFNYTPDSVLQNQNFKYVSWADVEKFMEGN
ncbi:MAG: phytase [Bacteroidetes bacterium]|jgi:3-phytase|nr:phytase [Bacteroidota bacterium]